MNTSFVKTLWLLCNKYQDIITDLDKALRIITELTEDKDILRIITNSTASSVIKLQGAQKLIDSLGDEIKISLMDDTSDTTH